MADDSQPIQIPLSWVGVEESVASAANQFLVQFDGDLHYLTLGQVTPPVLLGTEEEKKRQVDKLTMVPVRALGCYALSRKGIEELIGVLRTGLERADAFPRECES